MGRGQGPSPRHKEPSLRDPRAAKTPTSSGARTAAGTGSSVRLWLYGEAGSCTGARKETDTLLIEIAEIVLYPDAWLDVPNDRLGGQPPRAFLDSKEGREILHSLVQSVKHGMVT